MMGFGDAVASAGPYAKNLHLAPDRQPHQHLITQVFTGRMLFLTSNRRCQSTEGKNKQTMKYQNKQQTSKRLAQQNQLITCGRQAGLAPVQHAGMLHIIQNDNEKTNSNSSDGTVSQCLTQIVPHQPSCHLRCGLLPNYTGHLF